MGHPNDADARIAKMKDGSTHLAHNVEQAVDLESSAVAAVSRRFVKRQQTRWTLRGAHLLLQVRTKVLNKEFEEVFQRWYSLFPAQAQAA